MAFNALNIRGQGNWDSNAELAEIAKLAGTKLGDWQTETITESFGGKNPWESNEGGVQAQTRTYNRRYIDTPWGRVYDNRLDEYNRLNNLGEAEVLARDFAGYNPNAVSSTQFGLGRYHNEHGSDGIVGGINEDGVFMGFSMDRESNADMNTWLAIMATVGVGAAGGLAGIGLSDAAGLALAGASAYQASQNKPSGSVSAGGGDGDANIEGPSAPPAPPVIEYQDYHLGFAGANRKAAKNPTNINKEGVTNALFASGNLLLGA